MTQINQARPVFNSCYSYAFVDWCRVTKKALISVPIDYRRMRKKAKSVSSNSSPPANWRAGFHKGGAESTEVEDFSR